MFAIAVIIRVVTVASASQGSRISAVNLPPTIKSNYTDFANSKAVNEIMDNPKNRVLFHKLQLVRKFLRDLIKQPTVRPARELKLTTPKTTRNLTAKAFNRLEQELPGKLSPLSYGDRIIRTMYHDYCWDTTHINEKVLLRKCLQYFRAFGGPKIRMNTDSVN